MELLEAIKSRMSIRGFKPDPVPKEVLFELLRVATRSPSGVNCQPWEIYIVVGEALKELGQVYVEQFRQGIKPHPVVYAGQDRFRLQNRCSKFWALKRVMKRNCGNIMRRCTASMMHRLSL